MEKKITEKIVKGDKFDYFDLEIILADDGITAIEEVRKLLSSENKFFDFILCDNLMVHKNGPDAAKEMKSIPGFCSVILGVTGNSMQDQIDDFISSGAEKVLIKPLKPEELESLLLRYLHPASGSCTTTS